MLNIFGMSLLVVVAAASAFCQGVVSAPDQQPQRGISPNGFYAFDKLETIDQNSGNLMYHIPLTSMPTGRGGMSFPFVLNYNSIKYDFDYTYNVQTGTKNTTYKNLDYSPWGGWQMTVGYSIFQETNDPNNGDSSCNTSPKDAVSYRNSLVMPDGAHHTLYLENYTG